MKIENLKSFRKLFFTIIYMILTIFIYSESIAPELEEIQALPRKPKAELNIEVTKLKSEPLEDVYIDRKNKNIYVDFSKKRTATLRNTRTAEDLEKQYSVAVTNRVKSSGVASSNGKKSRVALQNDSQEINHEIVNFNGTKVMKIPYEDEPEKLYITVKDKNQDNIVKVYSILTKDAVSTASVNTNVENRTVTINYNQGFLIGTEIRFNLQGEANNSTISVNQPNGFINSIPLSGEGAKSNRIQVRGLDGEQNGLQSKDRYLGTQDSPEFRFVWNEKTEMGLQALEAEMKVQFFNDGTIGLTMIKELYGTKDYYEVEIEHSEIVNGQYVLMKKHLLRIKGTQKVDLVPEIEKKVVTMNLSGGIEEWKDQEFTFNKDGSFHTNKSGATLDPVGGYITGYQKSSTIEIKDFFDENISGATNKGEGQPSSEIRLDHVANISGTAEKDQILFKVLGDGSFYIKLIKVISQGSWTKKYSIIHKEKDSSGNYTGNEKYHTFIINGNTVEDTYEIEKEGSAVITYKDGFKNAWIQFTGTNVNNPDELKGQVTLTTTGNIDNIEGYNGIIDIIEGKLKGASENSFSIKRIANQPIDNGALIKFSDGASIQFKYEPSGMVGYTLSGAKTGAVYEFEILHKNTVTKKMMKQHIKLIEAEKITETPRTIIFEYPGYFLQAGYKFNSDTGIAFDRWPSEAPDLKITKTNGFTKAYGGLDKISVVGENGNSFESDRDTNKDKQLEGTIIFNDSTTIYIQYNSDGTFYYGFDPRNIYTSKEYKIYVTHKLWNKQRVDTIILKPTIIKEHSEVTMTYNQGFTNFWYEFNKNGVLSSTDNNLSVVKNSGTETLTSIPYIYRGDIEAVSLLSDNVAGITLKDIRNDNTVEGALEYENGNKVYLKYMPENGEFQFNISGDIIRNKEYKIKVTHKNKDNATIKEQILNIKEIPPKEFEVTKEINEIIINSDGTIKIPDIWVQVDQLTDNLGVFPVVTIDKKEKWEIETDRPLNPTNVRGEAILVLGNKTIKVPVNIRETPYQSLNKFFLYNRGDMTDRNLAVGGYTPIGSTTSGASNLVKVNFEMSLSDENVKEILDYANSKIEDKVTIGYSNEGATKMYAIRGIQRTASKLFSIKSSNILEEIELPKISVLKTTRNTANLTLKNPLPKVISEKVGTFDIRNGEVIPNNLKNYIHPSSITISGVTTTWLGFTVIPEVHRVDAVIGTSNVPVASFETEKDGKFIELKNIPSDGNVYTLMSGVETPLALGIKEWDFKARNETLKLKHYNKNGQLVAEDSYNISIPEFNLNTYLDSENSTLIKNKVDDKIKQTASIWQDKIDLGTLKLYNYQKDITKNTADLVGVRLEVPENEIELRGGDVILKGKLRFEGDKTVISEPNELKTLYFIPSAPQEQRPQNTFKISNQEGLIKLKARDKVLNKLTTLEITLNNANMGDLTDMSYISTVTSLKISDIDNLIKLGITKFNVPGMYTLRQYQGGKANSVPAIAIGTTATDWGTKQLWKKDYVSRTPKTERNDFAVSYTVSGKTITVYPVLVNSKATVDGGAKDGYLYTESSARGALTALSYVKDRNSINERITTELAFIIPIDQLKIIRDILKDKDSSMIELSPGDNAKISFIHARDKGSGSDERDSIEVPVSENILKKFSTIPLPTIQISKQNISQDLEMTFLPDYVNEEISFPSPNGIDNKVIITKSDARAMEGLAYKHKIRLTLPGGITQDYDTDDLGTASIQKVVEKNGKTLQLNINYTGEKAKMSLSNRNGSQDYTIMIEHIDPSGAIRKSTNIFLESKVQELNEENKGEMDIVISSRYNPLKSSPLLFTVDGPKYETEVLDLKLISGKLPEHALNKEVFINGNLLSKDEKEIELTNKTKIKVKKETNGDITIKPTYWLYNANDSFKLLYKDSHGNITHEYDFNIKCPEFFVASMGELDFGKIYKGQKNITKDTIIELEYNNNNVRATYDLDVSEPDPDGTLKDSLYLDDGKTLLVKDLKLGNEVIDNSDAKKRRLSLSGTIPNVDNVTPGIYQKTIQILIHLK